MLLVKFNFHNIEYCDSYVFVKKCGKFAVRALGIVIQLDQLPWCSEEIEVWWVLCKDVYMDFIIATLLSLSCCVYCERIICFKGSWFLGNFCCVPLVRFCSTKSFPHALLSKDKTTISVVSINWHVSRMSTVVCQINIVKFLNDLRWGSYREIGEDLLAQLGFFVLVDFRAIDVVEVTEISKETGHLMLW